MKYAVFVANLSLGAGQWMLSINQFEAPTSPPWQNKLWAFEPPKIILLKFSASRAKLVLKCPTLVPHLFINFFVKGKISSDPFLLSHLLIKLKFLLKTPP